MFLQEAFTFTRIKLEKIVLSCNKKVILPDVLLDLVVVEVRRGQELVELDHVADVQLLSLGKVASVQLFLGTFT
jgi:hypothetical protein